MHTFGEEPCKECQKIESDYIKEIIKSFFVGMFWKNIIMVFAIGTLLVAFFYSKFGSLGIILGSLATVLFMCATQSVK